MMKLFEKIVNGKRGSQLLHKSSTVDFQQSSKHGFASFEPIYIEIGIFYGSY